MDDATVEQLKSLLIGAVCTEVEYTGSLPFIRFGSIGLWIACAWRIVNDGEIVAGSDPGDNVKEEVRNLLVGQQLSSVEVTGDFNDLFLRFADGITLETFADNGEYERWHVSAGPGNMIVAGPGRLWSVWRP
ncbi:MAG TPA: hypothetical protein VFR15_19445 [Chloroflexia bacterium]|nr:hypothetical protein [Chloroflexia bacterium]